MPLSDASAIDMCLRVNGSCIECDVWTQFSHWCDENEMLPAFRSEPRGFLDNLDGGQRCEECTLSVPPFLAARSWAGWWSKHTFSCSPATQCTLRVRACMCVRWYANPIFNLNFGNLITALVIVFYRCSTWQFLWIWQWEFTKEIPGQNSLIWLQKE